jgi:hypothetical protein
MAEHQWLATDVLNSEFGIWNLGSEIRRVGLEIQNLESGIYNLKFEGSSV